MKYKILSFIALVILSAPVLHAGAKKADAYGFLPSASAEDNTAALQRCVDGGGTVRITVPGTYEICGTILLDSDTKLVFGKNVTISRARDSRGVSARHVFLNRGALDRSWNENITLKGLRLKVNGIDGGEDIPEIVGLRGHVAFFYARNVVVRDLEILDLASRCYGVQICTFENATVRDVHIEGKKDGVHFGPGRHFLVKNGIFKTYDDPIALNAHDYPTGNPEMGWIEDGRVENCFDLEDPELGTTGYFARIIAGAWRDWEEGMPIHINGDAVVSGGRIYRSRGPVEHTTITSTCRPVHESGTVTYPDGITWVMSQDQNVSHSCGVRNVVFRNIHLQKKRRCALSLHFDNDDYSRSYYPDAELPVQENIVFKKVFVEAEIPILLQARTPVSVFSVVDSDIKDSRIHLRSLDTPGMVYDTTKIVLRNIRCGNPDSLMMPCTRQYLLERR